MAFMKKWGVRIIGWLIIIFIISGVVSWIFKPSVEPSVEKAPWAIQTYSHDEMRIPSRIYYLEGVDIEGQYAVSTGNYWTFDGENYKKHNPKTWDKNNFDVEYIDIIRR